MLNNPFGLQNPYPGGAPPEAPQLAPVQAPQAPAQDPGQQSGATHPMSPEQVFAAPTPISFAATEQDVMRAKEAAENPAQAQAQTQTQQEPGSFLGAAPAPVPAPAPVADATQAQLAQVNYHLANLENDAAAAYNQLVMNGMAPELARQNVSNAAAQAKLVLENERLRIAAAPAVRVHVASDIATKHSVPGIKLTAQDLMGEGSPEAMTARARALVESRRATSTQQRVAQRTDVAETSSGVTSGMRTVAQNMNPFELIRSGLRQNGRRN